MRMHVLTTGNRGYIGSVLTQLLLDKGHLVTGYDTFYYEGCAFDEFAGPTRQIRKDIRDVSRQDLEGVDGIIHLAALSNDPLGAFDPELTYAINYEATVRLAEMAKEAGIPRFVLASSCSMYGMSGDSAISEDAPFDPRTAYAETKAKSEMTLSEMADDRFTPVYLRPSTAYGYAPMLRCDLVVNNLTGWACTTGKIRIMSDGTPWRPTVHVEDLANAFIACLEAPAELVHNEPFNIGRNKENYQIRDLAEIVKNVVPGCELEYTHEHGADSRTYTVSFDKLAGTLQDYFKPQWDVPRGVAQLHRAFTTHGLTEKEFTGAKYIRLNRLQNLIDEKKLDEKLFWR